jgi:hypothetical protein
VIYICAKGKEIHLQGGENTMTKQEIKKEILKEALNYLKNKKAYEENPCETSEDDVNHMLQEDAYLSSMERMEELYEKLLKESK